MEKEYLEQVKEYLKSMGHLSSDFGKFNKMYSMTTENIYGFLKNYNLKDKKILSVAGSGDQRLNAYLMGAKDVTCFDVNPLTSLQLKLKDEAIKKINFEKFIKFFGIYSHRYSGYYETLDKRIFDEFKHLLDENTYNLFKFLIEENQNISSRDIYFRFENNLEVLQKMNNYLNPDDYFALGEILKHKSIDFLNCNLSNLSKSLAGEKYDMILLSNISDYMFDLKSFRKIIDMLIDNLNMYGIIQFGYIYSKYGKYQDVGNFKDDHERQKYFPTNLFYTTMVDSYHGNNLQDKVITYQKLK